MFSTEAKNPQAPAKCKSSAVQFRWWRYTWFCRGNWCSEYCHILVK